MQLMTSVQKQDNKKKTIHFALANAYLVCRVSIRLARAARDLALSQTVMGLDRVSRNDIKVADKLSDNG
jgi:hypothetical protein